MKHSIELKEQVIKLRWGQSSSLVLSASLFSAFGEKVERADIKHDQR
ncbi:MAG: hypothetical protein K1X29_04520 [Bdellovibrionales bacterium]|nr:hypothetical protein [Bdellovibrionales bacterium]